MTRLALSMLGLVGCASPWTVLRHGAPQPATTQLAIETTTFDDVAGLTPEQQQAWRGDRLEIVGELAAAVIANRGALDIAGADRLDGRAIVRSRVVVMKLGEFNGFFNAPTELRTRVTITDPGQSPRDELEVRCKVTADTYRPSVSARISECARETGRSIARYLRETLLKD